MTFTNVILALVVLALLFDRARTQVATERERGRLLQRIQAPERAVAVHARREEGGAERRPYVPVSLDDDRAMASAHGEVGEEEAGDGGS